MSGNKEKGVQMRKQILEFIIEYMKKHGYAPSFKEIMVGVGLYSKSTVYNHIHKMYETGMLETDPEDGAPRAFRVPGYRFVRVEE